jgi:predicted ferric reductase
MKETNKRRLLVGFIIVSAVPAVLLVRYPSLVNAKTITLYLSAIVGYLGIVSLLWSYILGAKSVMGTVFRDLAPVISIHKWLGKYGTLAVFIHPLLVMYSYGENLLYLIVPQLGSEFNEHVTLGRIAFLVCVFIWITSAIIRDRMSFRYWRYLHMLGYIALPFAFLHVPDVGSHFMNSTAIKLYLYVIIITFFVFALLRLRGFLNVSASRYRVASQQRLVDDDPEIYAVELMPDEEWLVSNPGQYIYLKFDSILSEAHPFSVLDYSRETGRITVAYRTFGRFTKQMSELQPGETLLLTGPYGEFMSEMAETPDEPTVFIAGGIGVTPMIQHITSKPDRDHWLFYANRTKKSAMIVPGLRKLMGDRLVTIFSREPYPGTGDERGHFSADMLQKYLADPQKYRYYICGSDAMMQSTVDELRGLGIKSSRIYAEAFSW